MLGTISPTHFPNTHPLAHILGTDAQISVVAPCSQFTPTTSYPSPGDKPPELGDHVERHRSHPKTASLNSIIYIYTTAHHSFLSFKHCRTACTVISNSISVYPLPALHLLPPSILSYPYRTKSKPSRYSVILPYVLKKLHTSIYHISPRRKKMNYRCRIMLVR